MRISFLMFSSRDSQLFIQIYAEIHYTIRLHSYQLALPVWRRFREINELTIDAFVVTSLNALD